MTTNEASTRKQNVSNAIKRLPHAGHALVESQKRAMEVVFAATHGRKMTNQERRQFKREFSI